MHDPDNELDAELSAAIAPLRRTEPRSPLAIDRVMAAVAAERSARRRAWLLRPTFSPLAAAALLALAIATTFWFARTPAPPAAPLTANVHQFVLVAPDARSVSLVGDFNGWNREATPLRRQGNAWAVELKLPPGRHVYAFVVDGEEWVADASAAAAPEDEFGRPNSVILVPGTGT